MLLYYFNHIMDTYWFQKKFIETRIDSLLLHISFRVTRKCHN